jgi:hypothetical protein
MEQLLPQLGLDSYDAVRRNVRRSTSALWFLSKITLDHYDAVRLNGQEYAGR